MNTACYYIIRVLFNPGIFPNVGSYRLIRILAPLTKYADSVSVSLNKGLSAPMGAILAGDKSFIRESLRVRQMFGGGWRPTNIMAAAGRVALETMTDRLADDHACAKELAEGLQGCPGVSIDLQRVQTNIVLANISHPSFTLQEIIEQLRKEDILVLPFGRGSLRMVLYWEIGKDEVNKTIRAFHRVTEMG